MLLGGWEERKRERALYIFFDYCYFCRDTQRPGGGGGNLGGVLMGGDLPLGPWNP